MMDERFSLTKKVGIIGIIGNLFLLFLKITIGLLSHSYAMIADGVNSGGDVFASVMTWLGNRIAIMPKDDDHNYGHGKAEYIYTMLIGISMIVLSCKILYDAILSIINVNILDFSYKLIVVSIITIVIKIGLYIYTRLIYQKTGNLLVKSNMIDHRNDVMLTLLTLTAIILSKYQIYFVDGIVGIIISIWIIMSGIKLYKESYNVLMDQALDEKTYQKIFALVGKHQVITRIQSIYSLPIGYKYIVIITINVNGKMSTKKSHDIADKIEMEILNNIENIENVLVHVEPCKKSVLAQKNNH